jgi:predicted double-glycine peptidase
MKKAPTYLNKDNVEKSTSEKTEKKETYDKHLPEINLFSDARSGIDKDNLLLSDEEFAHGIFSDSESLLNDDANGNNVQQQGSQRLPVSEETLKTLMDCPKLTTNTFLWKKSQIRLLSD